ncbi:MAG: 2,3-bisphosphoglycerate-independent phosphoglycerate mutase [Gemmatimonadota bacterium]
MSEITIPDDLVSRAEGGSILLVVMDGLGGLPGPAGLTELEAARTPNLDAVAARSSLGVFNPVAPGVTPGSGPAHLALFGYDPLAYPIGRGTLSALGVGFDLKPGDVAFRLNLASLDKEGRISDRRAGRPSDAEGKAVIDRVRSAVEAPPGVELTILHEKEHRAVMVLRGEGLGGAVEDTDPQETGVPPLPARASAPDSVRTAELVNHLLDQARTALADHPRVQALLARGFDRYEGIPSFRERFGLSAVALAKYPMYRGVARLVGMAVEVEPAGDEQTVSALESCWDRFDYGFLHFKATDARGEDGDFDAKVAAIEAVDALIPRIVALEPDVLIVTGDHSTPAALRAHSWHPVPVLMASRWVRPTASRFGERDCRGGDLGHFHGVELMSLALAHAGRLEKYGA